jgi:hypothetical protein
MPTAAASGTRVEGAEVPTGTGEGEGAIRTPDQRLRVFVSSTLAELADERAAVGDELGTAAAQNALAAVDPDLDRVVAG